MPNVKKVTLENYSHIQNLKELQFEKKIIYKGCDVQLMTHKMERIERIKLALITIFATLFIIPLISSSFREKWVSVFTGRVKHYVDISTLPQDVKKVHNLGMENRVSIQQDSKIVELKAEEESKLGKIEKQQIVLDPEPIVPKQPKMKKEPEPLKKDPRIEELPDDED